ncbi:MAG: hypothetical protein H6509_10050 [Bryobacterales bacterium]|nr:hypothetical protein [Bryobacterales bacterium]
MEQAAHIVPNAIQDADFDIQQAQMDADQAIADAHDRASRIVGPNSFELAAVIIREAEGRAERMLDWAERSATRQIDDAEKQADAIRNHATRLPDIQPTQAVTTFLVQLAGGMIVVAFVGLAIRNHLGDTTVSSTGASLALAVAAALECSVASCGVLELLLPYLAIGTIYAGSTSPQRASTSVINGFVILFKRFGHILTLIGVSTTLTVGATASVMGLMYTVRDIFVSFVEDNIFEEALDDSFLEFFVVALPIGVAGYLAIGFFKAFFTLVTSLAFISIILGPQNTAPASATRGTDAVRQPPDPAMERSDASPKSDP